MARKSETQWRFRNSLVFGRVGGTSPYRRSFWILAWFSRSPPPPGAGFSLLDCDTNQEIKPRPRRWRTTTNPSQNPKTTPARDLTPRPPLRNGEGVTRLRRFSVVAKAINSPRVHPLSVLERGPGGEVSCAYAQLAPVLKRPPTFQLGMIISRSSGTEPSIAGVISGPRVQGFRAASPSPVPPPPPMSSARSSPNSPNATGRMPLSLPR